MNLLIKKMRDDVLRTYDVMQTDDILQASGISQANDILRTEEHTVEQVSQKTTHRKNTDTENSPIYTGEIGLKENLLDLNAESVLKGILFSEILGKPKSKRLGR